jgi:hypothetical protein
MTTKTMQLEAPSPEWLTVRAEMLDLRRDPLASSPAGSSVREKGAVIVGKR